MVSEVERKLWLGLYGHANMQQEICNMWLLSHNWKMLTQTVEIVVVIHASTRFNGLIQYVQKDVTLAFHIASYRQ